VTSDRTHFDVRKRREKLQQEKSTRGGEEAEIAKPLNRLIWGKKGGLQRSLLLITDEEPEKGVIPLQGGGGVEGGGRVRIPNARQSLIKKIHLPQGGGI